MPKIASFGHFIAFLRAKCREYTMFCCNFTQNSSNIRPKRHYTFQSCAKRCKLSRAVQNLRRRKRPSSFLGGAFFFCIFLDDGVRHPRWKILECWCIKSQSAHVTSRHNVNWTRKMRGCLNRWSQPPKWAKDSTAGCNPRLGKECTMVHSFPIDVVFYVRKFRSQITNVFG